MVQQQVKGRHAVNTIKRQRKRYRKPQDKLPLLVDSNQSLYKKIWLGNLLMILL